ncbi:hypothetical protein [Streptacidiphilus cavernicola]|uniref:PH domain-containing protein n=1 Tax=Streptacidiphilus cavernicola TaxID=3342716 RepID=A0ABV6VY32_9ACTN
MATKKHFIRLSREFDTREDAIAWFESLRRTGRIEPDTALYAPDALDKNNGADPKELLVRRAGDRPYGRLDTPIGG